jgi:hypothetical protein
MGNRIAAADNFKSGNTYGVKMANWHGYFAVENLNLNAAQRSTLVDALRKLGPKSDPQPARLNHWRTRLDGDAAIFEALFNEDALTVNAFKQRLGAIFGVSPVTIASTLQSVTLKNRPTPIATFSRVGVDYIRFAAFGGVGATWSQSGDECRAYLAANRDEWEN